ncbi:MAG: DNA-binding protein [Halobacteriota archaeon]|nr:DNA-binding protein [Halobacteriota archaeon]
MQEFRRESAKRVFAQEFRESDLSFKESEDEYAPKYLLTPTAAKCNRVFVVGTLTDKEDIGMEAEYWRARVADPTGVFLVYAGQFQAEATKILEGLEDDIDEPSIIAITGKPSTYETQDGDIITSIRPESIQVVDPKTRDSWIVDTAMQTMKRLKRMEEAEDGDDKEYKDIAQARKHYSTEAEYYKEMVSIALKTLEDITTETIDMSEI